MHSRLSETVSDDRLLNTGYGSLCYIVMDKSNGHVKLTAKAFSSFHKEYNGAALAETYKMKNEIVIVISLTCLRGMLQ